MTIKITKLCTCVLEIFCSSMSQYNGDLHRGVSLSYSVTLGRLKASISVALGYDGFLQNIFWLLVNISAVWR
jgi:hypothetical protein